MHLTLNQRFIAYLLLLGVLPLLALGTVSIQLSRSTIEFEARRNIAQELQDKVALLDVQMAQIETLTANVAGVEEITNAIRTGPSDADAYTRLAMQARIGYVLNNFLNLQGLVSIDIFTLSGDHFHVGETLSSGTVDVRLRDELIQETLARPGSIYWAGVRANINGNSKHRSVLVATRMIQRLNKEAGHQEPVAMLVVNYDPTYVSRQFSTGAFGSGHYMFLLDGNDRFAQHPDPALIGTKAGSEVLDTLRESATGRNAGTLMYTSPLHASGWRLVVLMPDDIIDRPARIIVRASAVVMLASLLMVGIGATFFFRRVVQPLRDITDRFRLLRTAPESRQPNIAVTGKDEIADLKNGFNDLLHALRARHEAEESLQLLNHNLEDRVHARTVDLVATNADLTVARDAAEVASKAKSTFLANMSHELRTPMNAIMGMTELARSRSTDLKQRDQLNKITQASRHLLAVINDILDISRIEADRVTLVQSRFTVATVLDNVLGQMEQAAAQKGLQQLVEISPAVAIIPVQGDPTRLGQILLNLISNALKFTEKGTVTVGIQVVEEAKTDLLLRFEVRDTGVGISDNDRERLFTAFEQVDNSMTRKYGGTGLGLAISKRLAQLMGGEIGVESQQGVGSAFWFTARLSKATSATSLPQTQSGLAESLIRADHAGARILLVEDDPLNQEVARELLMFVELEVDVAADGMQALAMASKRRYDAILMDMRMPKLNGIDATLAIRSSGVNANTPILAMTANAFDEDRQACVDAGMNGHIAKPVDPDRLYEALLKCLSLSVAGSYAVPERS